MMTAVPPITRFPSIRQRSIPPPGPRAGHHDQKTRRGAEPSLAAVNRETSRLEGDFGTSQIPEGLSLPQKRTQARLCPRLEDRLFPPCRGDQVRDRKERQMSDERIVLAYSNPRRRIPDLEITLRLVEDRKYVAYSVRRVRGSGPVPRGCWLFGKNVQRLVAALTELGIKMPPQIMN
jgi:hypothetical protein